MATDEVSVSRSFKQALDHYSGPRWRTLAENLGLDGDGFITCDECGEDVHVYSAKADGDGGYNEQLASYITFADEVIICGNCMFEAFDSLEIDSSLIFEIRDGKRVSAE